MDDDDNGGGWLTVKKRGRDDDRIAADRAHALDARRGRRGLPPRKQKKAAAPAGKKKAARRRRQTKTEERLDSMGDFIVDSSEEDEAEYERSSDEESEEELPDDVELEDDDDDDDDEPEAPHTDDDDDSSDDESLFPTFPKKRNQPANGKLPAKKPAAAAKKKGGRRLKKVASNSNNNNNNKHQRRQVTNDSFSSDDDDVLDDSKTSKCFSKKKDSDDYDDYDDDSSDAKPKAAKKPQPKSVLEHHALEDTPLEEDAIRKKPAKKSKHWKKGNSNQQFSELTVGQGDYCEDSDEAMALFKAQEESLKEASKSSPAAAAAAATNSSSSNREVVDLQDSSSDEEQGDEKDDGYVMDEEAEAASSILQTADELSAKIIRTMANWSESAVDGMIVDGALSLSTLSTAAAAASTEEATEHTWISAETMREILPDVRLADYQLIGVNWLALLHGMKCVMKGGNKKSQYTNVNGILADEMGLGKTVQTIAFVSWLKHCDNGDKKKSSSTGFTKEDAVELDDSDGDGDGDDGESVDVVSDGEATHPHLVIAPASVLSNWKIEFEKFAPDMKVVKYHGTMEERIQLQHELRQFLPGKKKRPGAGVDVILAPITYFQKEKSDDRAFLRKFAWNYMIVDEGHQLKNAKGLRYKSLDVFATMHRLLLTGTPVQNSPKELLSLLCFLMPLFKRSSGSDFDDDRNKNDGGESMLQHFVSLESGGTAESDYQAAFRKLKKLFSPFVLRRRKDDVMSQIMPPKEKKVEMVELGSEARLRYNSVIENHLNAKKKGSGAVKEHLFTQLRKAAHHPLMLRSRYTDPEQKQHLEESFYKFGAFRGEACTKEKVAEELEKFNDFDIHLTALELVESNTLLRDELDRYILKEDDLFCSAKFVRLQKLLPELIGNGHRILIFSVWTTCLDLLSCLMEQMGLDYLRMDGQTAVSDRQSLIDKFNRDSTIPIFLLSTKACGLGINLTAADTCIMHDLDFNPFNDLQAEDRCHRIGQTKKVSIIKLVSKDTVDEDIYDMQQRKALMNSAIMDNENDFNKNAADVKKLIEQTAISRYRKSTAAAGATNSKGIAIEKENALELNEDVDVEEDL